ncbi:HipA domain-containing protein [Idiomarina sp. A28L]|uniref:HipA domain-containing protein n=1 Tax=Idiomarina sp. A28L TaxID=1036674 RepID=UPI0002138CC3|nr:HipA domain-containing protein [Idiomarina sp. A28L]EGN74619.1 HipA domain-containing protein [Idiomarina sp. A28L]
MSGSNKRASLEKASTLNVFIGANKKIATLSLPIGSETELSLSYEPSWVEQGFPLSPHLPFHQAIPSSAVRNYLQNLLPEGQGLEDITTNTTVSKNNTFGLIRIIGAETSGALSFRSPNAQPIENGFRPITSAELSDKLERHQKSGEPITLWDGRTRLSVAGVQDKLNLLEFHGEIGFGEGNLCSNKIFKFETGKAPFIAANELFTMLLAKHSGLETPQVEIREYGAVRTFVVDRFDRYYIPEQNIVKRRHVIDGCQATNLPPSYKYERQYGDQGDGKYIRDGVSFPRLFAVNTINREAYQLKLLQWLTFNIVVRNYDAHGKNLSFFVGTHGLELTPFYDLVNIEAILVEIERGNSKTKSPSARTYAMSIGDYEAGSEGNFENPITAYMLADFAQSFGISPARTQLIMGKQIEAIVKAIAGARNEALEKGLTEPEIEHIDLCVSIIESAVNELSNEMKQIPAMAKRL